MVEINYKSITYSPHIASDWLTSVLPALAKRHLFLL